MVSHLENDHNQSPWGHECFPKVWVAIPWEDLSQMEDIIVRYPVGYKLTGKFPQHILMDMFNDGYLNG